MTKIVPFPIQRLPEGWCYEGWKYTTEQKVRHLRLRRAEMRNGLKDGTWKMQPGLDASLEKLDRLLDKYAHIR